MTSGCQAETRTWMPPTALPHLRSKRLTDAGVTLQIAHVDAGGVEAGDDGALDHARSRMLVAAAADLGALVQGRAVGHGQLERQLRGDIDVDQPGDAVLAEQGRERPPFPDDAGIDVSARPRSP